MQKHLQKGSATMLSVGILMFISIVMAGLLPLVNTQVKLTAKNQDNLEAQYAAEAGAKRAIVGLEQSRTDWSWANNITKNSFIDAYNTTKYYVVNVINQTTLSPIADGSAPASGTIYKITSVGTVNGVTKTVSLSVAITGGSSTNPPPTPAYIGDAAFYSGNSITFKNNTVIHGASSYSVGATNYGNKITYDTNSGYSEFENKPALSFPSVSYSSGTLIVGAKNYNFSASQSLSNSTTTINLNASNNNTAYSSSAWTPTGDITITGSGVVYINGDFLLNNNITCTDPAGVLFVVQGNLDGSNANNVNINKAAILVSGNVLPFKNNFTLYGSLAATGSLGFAKNNAKFNYDAATASTWLPTTSNRGNPSTGSASIVPQSWNYN